MIIIVISFSPHELFRCFLLITCKDSCCQSLNHLLKELGHFIFPQAMWIPKIAPDDILKTTTNIQPMSYRASALPPYKIQHLFSVGSQYNKETKSGFKC